MPPLTFEAALGFVYVLGFILVVGLAVAYSRLPVGVKRLVYVALALRVVGAFARYYVLFVIYGGVGDANGYYGGGLDFATRLWSGDFSPFYDSSLWWGGSWKETGFVAFPSMFVLALIGASMIGEFVAFSLLAFLGLVGFAVAFHRTHPHVPLTRYARWIWLFPSLWFWPSAVGKEALIMMGIGLAMAGFIGKNERVQWPLLVIGAFFVWAIRPQVAAVLIFSFVIAYWLSLGSRWTVAKTVQGLVILGVGMGGLWLAMDSMGVQDFGVEGVQEYMLANQAESIKGTTVDVVGISPAGIPMAMVNVLSRPWPWEANNAMSMLSALELLTFWGIVFYRRKSFFRALRGWRTNPLLRVALPFVIIYSASLGMLLVNLGIIARQRVFLFPFLFLLVEAIPAARRRRAVRRMPVYGAHVPAHPGFAERGA